MVQRRVVEHKVTRHNEPLVVGENRKYLWRTTICGGIGNRYYRHNQPKVGVRIFCVK